MAFALPGGQVRLNLVAKIDENIEYKQTLGSNEATPSRVKGGLTGVWAAGYKSVDKNGL